MVGGDSMRVVRCGPEHCSWPARVRDDAMSKAPACESCEARGKAVAMKKAARRTKVAVMTTSRA